MPRRQRLPKYVTEERDARGRLYVYFRRPGKPKVRMRDTPWSAEFMRKYAELLGGKAQPMRNQPRDGTLQWLVDQYEKSAEFGQLDKRTRHVRLQILRACLAESVAPGDSRQYGTVPVRQINGRAIRVLRDRKADKPEAANGRVKALRQVFKYGVEAELCDRNPARDIPYLSTHSEGFHSWTLEEVERFEAAHPIGTRARLALALLLYTGQRRSDVVAFGPGNVRDGWLVFTQAKNRRRKPVKMEIPVRPELAAVIAGTAVTGKETWLVTEFGRPFTAAGFGNRFRKWCNEAGLPHCSAHGLRKAAASRLAELGASEQQIMAITGHQTSKEVTRYTKAARQRVMAAEAFALGEKEKGND